MIVNDFTEVLKTIEYTPSMEALQGMTVDSLRDHKLESMFWGKVGQLA